METEAPVEELELSAEELDGDVFVTPTSNSTCEGCGGTGSCGACGVGCTKNSR